MLEDSRETSDRGTLQQRARSDSGVNVRRAEQAAETDWRIACKYLPEEDQCKTQLGSLTAPEHRLPRAPAEFRSISPVRSFPYQMTLGVLADCAKGSEPLKGQRARSELEAGSSCFRCAASK